MNIRIETQLNWRMIKNAFQTPHRLFGIKSKTQTALSVFFPHDRNFDVLALRNWLYDSDNNSDGFQLIGCFERDFRRKVRFIGLKLNFYNSIDAVYCRLAWNNTTAAS